MKILIVDGVQGKKKKKFTKKNFTNMIRNKSSTEKKIYDLDLKKFDAAYICTSDSKKFEIIKYLLNKKTYFGRKPLPQKFRSINILKKISKKQCKFVYSL